MQLSQWREATKPNNMSILKKILDEYPDEGFLKADGFDDAIIGVSSKGILVYSIQKCIDILMDKHKMDYPDAIDFFYYNVEGSFVGEKTPIWVNDNFNF